MPADTIEVKPKPKVIQYVKINIYQLILNWGFRCACYMLDSQGIVIEQQDVIIEGEEYNSWMNDDEMVLVILGKLGLEPASVNVVSDQPVSDQPVSDQPVSDQPSSEEILV